MCCCPNPRSCLQIYVLFYLVYLFICGLRQEIWGWVQPCRIEGQLFEGSVLLLSPQVMGKIENPLRQMKRGKCLGRAVECLVEEVGRERGLLRHLECFITCTCKKLIPLCTQHGNACAYSAFVHGVPLCVVYA